MSLIDDDLGRFTDGNDVDGKNPEIVLRIAVALKTPGMWFIQDMTAQEEMQKYIRWFTALRFQTIKIGPGGPHEKTFALTEREIVFIARPRLTRQGAFE